MTPDFGSQYSSFMQEINDTLANGGTHLQAFQGLISQMGLSNNSNAKTLAAAPFGVGNVKDNGRGQQLVSSAEIARGEQQVTNGKDLGDMA